MTNEEIKEKLEKYFEEQGMKAEEASEEELVKAKSMVMKIPYCDVANVTVDPRALSRITKEKALKYCCIPFGFDSMDSSVLTIVSDDPLNYDKADDLRIITEAEISFVLGSRSAILKKIEECYAPEGVSAKPAENLQPKAPESAQEKPKAGDDGIERFEINEQWAHSGIVKAGDYCFLSYCVGNIGGTIEEQINGAFDNMEARLAMVGLKLENVVQMDCLFRDVYNIPIMEKVIKERFHGKYPARKSIETNFAHVGGKDGLHFQVDAIAYFGRK
ncbi:MAG: hypothetical protein IK081_06380 [Lachnospiraceae bacterium]|nr:hypothetical protein [Lachnospiraceae bacterium]